jgi:hypothetical protein
MDWIKKNYDKFILAVSAVLLMAVGIMLFLSSRSFGEKFSDVLTTPAKSDKIPEVDMAKIKEAEKGFNEPAKWKSDVHSGFLFTSEGYVVKDNKLEKVATGGVPHSRTAEMIPNKWLLEHGLSPFEREVGLQDPDGDGFLTEDEFIANPKTDPTKKDSHPPYYTQLFLTNWKTSQFRWRLQAITGDAKNDKPGTLDFQINTLDLSRPTEFLKLGDTVSKTSWKLKSFQFKEIDNPATGEKKDTSELTLVNTETSEPVVLPLLTIVNSPTQTGEFEYRWNKKPGQAGQPISVLRLKDFVLQPEINAKYKLLDGNQENAVIQLPDGKTTYTVPKLNAPTKAPAPAPSAPASAPSTPAADPSAPAPAK